MLGTIPNAQPNIRLRRGETPPVAANCKTKPTHPNSNMLDCTSSPRSPWSFAHRALSPRTVALCVSASLLAACGGSERERPPPEAPALHERPADDAALVEARTMTVAIDEGAVAAESRAKLLSDLARQPGSNFGEVAREYTGDAPARVRFERGAIADDQAALAEAVFALQVGEVSRPVRTSDGFVIARREPNPTAGPAQVGARHILIMHTDSERAPEGISRTRDEALALAREIAQRAKAGEDWATLHQEHTDEPGSPPGGDLGTFGRGQMVPAFETAVWKMAPGDTSDPVETPFGFHVIQRTQ